MEELDWTERYNNIKKNYNIFLDNFIYLADTLGLYGILEIDKLFEYLLKNNLIGNNKIEKLDNVALLENKDILGANTFSDGVCRHKSFMLKDIYHKQNYDSTVVLGCFYQNEIKPFNKIITDPNIKPELGELEYNNINYKVIEKYGSYFVFPIYHDIDFYEKLDPVLNHAIVLVGDKKRIFIDPTLHTKYFLELPDKISARDENGKYFFIWEPRRRVPGINFYTPVLQKTYNKIMALEAMDMEEVSKLEKEIDLFLQNKKDIINEFINDNQKEIEDIKSNCLSLRKSMKNIGI